VEGRKYVEYCESIRGLFWSPGPIWLFKTWAVLALTGAKTAPLKGTVLGSKLLCPDGEGLDAGVLRL
jgi:hypothetical protein